MMTELQLGFFDVMLILEDIQTKKKLPIEIIERSGEVAIGEIERKGASQAVSTAPKPEPKPESPMEPKPVEKKWYRCTNCGREMEERYKYCPGCGRPLKITD